MWIDHLTFLTSSPVVPAVAELVGRGRSAALGESQKWFRFEGAGHGVLNWGDEYGKKYIKKNMVTTSITWI